MASCALCCLSRRCSISPIAPWQSGESLSLAGPRTLSVYATTSHEHGAPLYLNHRIYTVLISGKSVAASRHDQYGAASANAKHPCHSIISDGRRPGR